MDGARHLRAVFAVALVSVCAASAATLPSDWQREQAFNVPAPGLVKLSLPIETIDATRPALEDLRVYDDAGNEAPYLIERPVPVRRAVQGAKSFQVSLNPSTTIIILETGLTQPLDGVTLESPATSLIKPVKVEGSTDGARWQSLVQGQPIFRQPNGVSQLHLTLPAGVWQWLRLTVDDQRSTPVPFTGARVHLTVGQLTPGELMSVTIAERHENPGETRLTLNLNAANLNVATIQMETPESLFTRQVTLAVPEILEDSIREQTVAQGVIYRVAIEGRPASAQLSVPVNSQVRSRDLLLLIRNQDSPPLAITAVRVERRFVYLVFVAQQAGAYHLLTGNSRCPAPRYDLAALGASFKTAATSPIKLAPLADNPNYRSPEVLPGMQEGDTALDVSAWKFRKPIKLIRPGAQQLDLDLDVLSHAQPGFQDVRVLRGGKQIPYILQRTSISRALTPVVTTSSDAKDPKLSRWIIKLSHVALPVTRVACTARTALFQREVTLYEEVTDERGDKYRRLLSQASWTQTPDRANKEFVLTIDTPLQSDTLFLETHNGDNPPIELERFQIFYPVTRALFKATREDALLLYYGNPRVAPPRYDLSLVASQLHAADKMAASTAAEEQLRKPSWRENQPVGKGGMLFWGVLALVVVVLLIIISRLLPKSSPPVE